MSDKIIKIKSGMATNNNWTLIGQWVGVRHGQWSERGSLGGTKVSPYQPNRKKLWYY